MEVTVRWRTRWRARTTPRSVSEKKKKKKKKKRDRDRDRQRDKPRRQQIVFLWSFLPEGIDRDPRWPNCEQCLCPSWVQNLKPTNVPLGTVSSGSRKSRTVSARRKKCARRPTSMRLR